MQLDIENKEKLLERLNAMFMNSFYADKLKINPDYIKAFRFYIVEDKDFVDYVNAKNKTAINFRIFQSIAVC